MLKSLLGVESFSCRCDECVEIRAACCIGCGDLHEVGLVYCPVCLVDLSPYYCPQCIAGGKQLVADPKGCVCPNIDGPTRCVVCQRMHDSFSDYCPKCSDQIQRDYEEMDLAREEARIQAIEEFYANPPVNYHTDIECDWCHERKTCRELCDRGVWVMSTCNDCNAGRGLVIHRNDDPEFKSLPLDIQHAWELAVEIPF